MAKLQKTQVYERRKHTYKEDEIVDIDVITSGNSVFFKDGMSLSDKLSFATTSTAGVTKITDSVVDISDVVAASSFAIYKANDLVKTANAQLTASVDSIKKAIIAKALANPTSTNLVDVVKTLNSVGAGIKFATGGPVNFTTSLSARGLGFRPSLILMYPPGAYSGFRGAYSNGTYIDGVNEMYSNGRRTNVFTQYNDGFTINTQLGNTFSVVWIAIA